MQLLHDIINDLVSSDSDLSSALRKTKLLAHRLKNEDLKNWVSKELDGYDEREDLPEYRITEAAVLMDYTNGFTLVRNVKVPMLTMPKKTRKFLCECKFSLSVATLESYAKSKNSSMLSVPLPAESADLIQQYVTTEDNSHFQIVDVRKLVSTNAAVNIIALIKNRLLDFAMELENEFGSETDIESLQKKSQAITTIMYNTITNHGDGNVVNTGNEAIQTATLTFQKIPLDDLIKKLQANKVSEIDINELTSVIDNDTVDIENKRFGPKVNLWFSKMIQKSLDGGWEIGVATAGGVLTEVLKSYYGF